MPKTERNVHLTYLLLFYFQALQSGGPRTTPSGYPGGPIVPSGNLSPPGHYPPSHHHHHTGYATTGRISHHQQQQQQQQQQQPMSFTRALEVSESLSQQPGSLPNPGVNPNHHPQFSGPGGAPMDPNQASGVAPVHEGDRRESVYDYHEISV